MHNLEKELVKNQALFDVDYSGYRWCYRIKVAIMKLIFSKIEDLEWNTYQQ
jgi:hypothetical protein